MKKLLCFVLATLIVLGTAACGGKSTLPDSSAEESNVSSEENNAEQTISVEKNLMTVDVTFPASFYDGVSEDEIKSEAEAKGFKKYTINSDGSVTFTMSKAKHAELLDAIKTSIDESINEMISGDEPVASFRKIDYDDSLSRFSVYVDEDAFNNSLDALNALTFIFSGVYYQVFEGVDPEEIDVIINYYNADTNDLIDSSSYQNMIASIADLEDDSPESMIDEAVPDGSSER